MDARIPFGGFYESMWSRGIDEEEEQYAAYLAEKHEIPQGEIAEMLFRNSMYFLAYRKIASSYVEHFESFIKETWGTDVMLQYREMTSPREYNFETDKIFINVMYRDALVLARKIGRNALRRAAKEMFTSRDGFISFYSNDISTWGPLRTWDHNQLYCLFTAAVADMEDYDWGIYEHMSESGAFSNAYNLCYDVEEIQFELGKLVGRKEFIEEQEEESDDGKRFPVAYKDTQDYVRRYEDMNKNILNSNKL